MKKFVNRSRFLRIFDEDGVLKSKRQVEGQRHPDAGQMPRAGGGPRSAVNRRMPTPAPAHVRARKTRETQEALAKGLRGGEVPRATGGKDRPNE